MRLPGRQPRRIDPRRSVAWVGALLVAFTVAACSDGGDGAIPTSTTRRSTSSPGETSSTSTSTTLPGAATTEEEEISARYAAFWDARFEANQAPPNPDHPGLREYAAAEQLANVVEETQHNLEQGLALRKPADSVASSSVQVVEVSGDEATVHECAVDDGIVYRYETDEVVNDAVATHSVRATLRRVAGEWKVTAAELVQRWEGVAGCAAAHE